MFKENIKLYFAIILIFIAFLPILDISISKITGLSFLPRLPMLIIYRELSNVQILERSYYIREQIYETNYKLAMLIFMILVVQDLIGQSFIIEKMVVLGIRLTLLLPPLIQQILYMTYQVMGAMI